MYKNILRYKKSYLTHATVSIAAGELYGAIVCASGVFFVLLLSTIGQVSVRQSIVNQVHLHQYTT